MSEARQKFVLIFGNENRNEIQNISSRLLWLYTNRFIIDEDAQHEIDKIYFNCDLARLSTYLFMNDKRIPDENLIGNFVKSSENCDLGEKLFHLHILIENGIYHFRGDVTHTYKTSLRNILSNWLPLFIEVEQYKSINVTLLQGFSSTVVTKNEWKFFEQNSGKITSPSMSPIPVQMTFARPKRLKLSAIDSKIRQIYSNRKNKNFNETSVTRSKDRMLPLVNLWNQSAMSISDDLESLETRLKENTHVFQDEWQRLYYFRGIKNSDICEHTHHLLSLLEKRIESVSIHSNENFDETSDEVIQNLENKLLEFNLNYIQYACSRFTFTINKF